MVGITKVMLREKEIKIQNKTMYTLILEIENFF